MAVRNKRFRKRNTLIEIENNEITYIQRNFLPHYIEKNIFFLNDDIKRHNNLTRNFLRKIKLLT